MLDLVERIDALHLAVGEADVVIEELGVETRHRDEGGLVDGGGEDRAAVRFEVLGVIGPAP